METAQKKGSKRWLSAGVLDGEGMDFVLSCCWFSFHFWEEGSEKLGQSLLHWGPQVIPAGIEEVLSPGIEVGSLIARSTEYHRSDVSQIFGPRT